MIKNENIDFFGEEEMTQNRPHLKIIKLDYERVKIMEYIESHMKQIYEIATEILKVSFNGKSTGSTRNWLLAQQVLSKIIYTVKMLKEFGLLFKLIMLYGQINLFLENLKRAIEVFSVLRDLAYELQDYKLIVEAYKLLGGALQRDKRYGDAVICYKKMLNHAWFHNDKETEIQAYQCLSTQHFYLANVKIS